MLFEDRAGVGVDLAETDCSESFRFKGQGEPADSTKEVKMSWFIGHALKLVLSSSQNLIPAILLLTVQQDLTALGFNSGLLNRCGAAA